MDSRSRTDIAIPPSIGAFLVTNGRIEARGLERASRVAADSGQDICTGLVQLGLIGERDLAMAFSAMLDMPLATAADYPDEPVLPQRLGMKFLRQARALPIRLEADRLVLAMADPQNTFVPRAVASSTGMRVTVAVAVPIELDAALTRLYATPATAVDTVAPVDDLLEADAEKLRDLASEAPVIRLVNLLIGQAVDTLASDIHIEPFEDRLRVRYRYDGVLHDADSPPAQLAAAIISRIKIMAHLDIAERRLPQDGRIRMAVRGQDVDFRVSTIPTLHGETVVLRVLDRTAAVLDYERLGLPAPVIVHLRDALALPNGIVLVTGPTGSGKTTTLYTGLLQMNAVARKIITIEDPIEYQLAGINQTQVRPRIDLTFANLLRSILRQDPDVIMVGEIRDLETAEIAVQAALTGHLVLSTLHTNSAAACITRLRDMGLEDYLLSAVLRGVLAQRLVRRLCMDCRIEQAAAPEVVARFGLAARRPGPLTLWHAKGCPACRGTGYRGRVAVAEFLRPSPDIERLILTRADHTRIETAAVEAGMVPLFEAGLQTALDGITTIEEVLRSVQASG
jgi:general secretion pathway protein E